MSITIARAVRAFSNKNATIIIKIETMHEDRNPAPPDELGGGGATVRVAAVVGGGVLATGVEVGVAGGGVLGAFSLGKVEGLGVLAGRGWNGTTPVLMHVLHCFIKSSERGVMILDGLHNLYLAPVPASCSIPFGHSCFVETDLYPDAAAH